jgi:hypothetical protein
VVRARWEIQQTSKSCSLPRVVFAIFQDKAKSYAASVQITESLKDTSRRLARVPKELAFDPEQTLINGLLTAGFPSAGWDGVYVKVFGICGCKSVFSFCVHKFLLFLS